MNKNRPQYVTLKEFAETCNKFFTDLTYKEICYLYIGFDDDVIIHWNKIHITEMIVIYVQNYLIYNIK